MEKLSIIQIIEKIEKEQAFEAVTSDYSFMLKIEEYVPYVCAAIHDGHQFRKELWHKCTHTEYERWYEEDPATKYMIHSHPIVITGLDSRFEYDLNRSPETAIYNDAWGKQLWHIPLTKEEKNKSLQKHMGFYRVVEALIKKIESKFTTCLVFDMHSYNWKRWERTVPTWNIGTVNIDNKKYEDVIEKWRATLNSFHLPNKIESSAKINDTFQGNGYFLKFITQNFKNTLVLATEIAKVYCDELTQIMYPEVINSVEKSLKIAIKENAKSFYKQHKL
ncbi:N-formylglutamate amidohydrolase [Tenacibaculum sp. 190524A02b]|uniref:N-formylglutamate amidohydrolase n=1 Tax=Tenacibaculum vairaonense TaxID=3137860 RepID=UPI0032B10378